MKLPGKAVYEVVDPAIESKVTLRGRGDLDHPVVLWVKEADHSGWSRCSPVVELSVARKWHKSWGKTYTALAITPAYRISRVVQLPSFPPLKREINQTMPFLQRK